MKDSIEIPQTEENKQNSPSEIKELKQDLVGINQIKESAEEQTQKNDQIPENLNNNNLDNNNQNNEDIVNIKMQESANPPKIIKKEQRPKTSSLTKGKNAYSNFIKNIRTVTPNLRESFNKNNISKNKITNSFSKSLNNFFRKNKIICNDDDDAPSLINEDPIKLRNTFQHFLGKSNENSTKEISFKKLKELITENHSSQDLRVYISCLSTYSRNATITGMEIYALLYGFLSVIYKENLMDPIDNPPNIIKTINRILTHIRQYYLNSNSYVVHKAASRSLCDIYDNCMPKENVKSIYMIFLEPLLNILNSGVGKSTQEGAAICLCDFVVHLGENKKMEINKKILESIDEKIIFLCIKPSLENPYLFEALYNLINFNDIENISGHLKEIYDRCIMILCKTNKNKYNYLIKVNCLNILNLIGNKIRNVADITIGYYQNEIFKVIEFNTRDKNAKVNLAAKKALKTWNELKQIHDDLDNQKREIKNNINKDTFINNNNDIKKDDDNESHLNIQGNDKLVRKMDKFNFLRNLAKMAKIENQKIDYDSELPEKMKEEVYKKGISNVLNLSKFLKFKTQNTTFNKRDDLASPTKHKKKVQSEVEDYLKFSKQVKKYDAYKKIQNQREKNYDNENILYANENTGNNIIKEEENNFDEKSNNNLRNKPNQIKKIEYQEEDQFKGGDQMTVNFYNNANNYNNNPIIGNNMNINDNKGYSSTDAILPEQNNKILYNNNYNNPNLTNDKGYSSTNLNNNYNTNSTNNNVNYNETNPKNNQDYSSAFINKSNPIIDQNDLTVTNNNNEINLNPKFLKNNVDDSSNFNNNINQNQINQNTKKEDDDQIKNYIQNMFNETIYTSFTKFENTVTNKLNNMKTRLNEISLKISDYQLRNNNYIKNLISNNKDKNINKSNANNISCSSYKQAIENTSFFINNQKFKANSEKLSVNTEECETNNFVINNNNLQNNTIDSEVTRTWKESLNLVEKGNINEGYLKILNSGDDIYLLRLIYLTGPVIDRLDPKIISKVLIRVNLISKSYQIQHLLVGLIRNAVKNKVFRLLDPNQQNYILDSLYEFSGLNNGLANEAAELYAQLTKFNKKNN